MILLPIVGAVVRNINFDNRLMGIIGKDDMPLVAMGGRDVRAPETGTAAMPPPQYLKR